MTATNTLRSGPTSAEIPANAIHLSVGDNYQSIVENSAANAVFVFDEGVHRLTQPLDPKDGQTFIGQQGAVLDGGAVLTSFTQQGSLYVASGQTQEGLRIATGEAVAERGGFPETVFVDGHPLKPVASLGAVKPGSFYFDYAADKIYLADNPSGHTVEAGIASAAFESDASGVTISNLVIQHFNAPTQHGAIQGGENWTVENNEVRLNYGVGITVQDGGKIIGNNVHDNGQMGIGGNGANILVEGNDIGANGSWSGIDPFWEGGGSKFAQTTNLVVRDNYSHDNHGFGLWTDVDNIDTLYEGNLVVNNDGGGINHEISYDAVIRNNTFAGNGEAAQGDWLWGAAIQLQNAQNVDVYGNKIDMSDGLNGIGLIQQDRGSGAYGEYTTTGNTVHDNVLVSTGGDGRSGAVADFNEAGLLNGGNVFSDNQYFMDGGNHWWWGDLPSGDTWAAYQSDTDQDNGSTLSSATPPDTSAWLTG
ncbi:MAG: right-handed parallel beta-helix repeat-containing protein, partial [Zymomonas sp.]